MRGRGFKTLVRRQFLIYVLLNFASNKKCEKPQPGFVAFENGKRDFEDGQLQNLDLNKKRISTFCTFSSTGAFPPDADTSINSIEDFPYAIYTKDASETRRPLIVRSNHLYFFVLKNDLCL